MEHLFAALQERHPGHDLIDIRFSVDPTARCEMDPMQIDRQLAQAVRTARTLDVESLMAELGLS